MAKTNKIFKPTKINLSEMTDKDALGTLDMKFTEYRILRQQAVEGARNAAIAKMKSTNQEGAAGIALTEFLQMVGEHFEEVQTEPVWFAYRQNGEIIVESPYTERDMRNGLKLQRAQMEQQAQHLDESDHSSGDLYETDED